MSDLVGNPEDRFSHNEAHFSPITQEAPMLAYVVLHDEETEEPGENRRPWTGGHYTVTCLCLNAKPGRSGKKRMFYHYSI